jgi:hypothetical protein
MSKLVSFEEVCKVSHAIVTAEAFNIKGHEAVMDEYRTYLSSVGWTSEEIYEETRRRFLLHIEQRALEELDKSMK